MRIQVAEKHTDPDPDPDRSRIATSPHSNSLFFKYSTTTTSRLSLLFLFSFLHRIHLSCVLALVWIPLSANPIVFSSVADLDPHGSGAARIRIHFGRLNPVPHWEYGSGSSRAEKTDKSEVNCNFWSKHINFISTVNFFKFLVIKTLDLDLDTDTDPLWQKMRYPDPHWNQCGSATVVFFPLRYFYFRWFCKDNNLWMVEWLASDCSSSFPYLVTGEAKSIRLGFIQSNLVSRGSVSGSDPDLSGPVEIEPRSKKEDLKTF
jgi:hypothetical protein